MRYRHHEVKHTVAVTWRHVESESHDDIEHELDMQITFSYDSRYNLEFKQKNQPIMGRIATIPPKVNNNPHVIQLAFIAKPKIEDEAHIDQHLTDHTTIRVLDENTKKKYRAGKIEENHITLKIIDKTRSQRVIDLSQDSSLIQDSDSETYHFFEHLIEDYFKSTPWNFLNPEDLFAHIDADNDNLQAAAYHVEGHLTIIVGSGGNLA